ncbi:MAG TPA: hypothetical protein VGV35_06160 [Bryobacteraceae bacterium]|nr:hypothetical protein [Bryobacteraceae bacterium]
MGSILPKSALCLMLAAAAPAQDNAPPGLLRGILLTWSATADAGAFTFLGFENNVYSCSYDRKTYMERDNERITFARAQKGDRLEVVTDRRLASGQCYARTVHILEDPRTRLVPGLRPRPNVSSALASLPPRGDLTFTGVVVRVTSTSLTLRSRSGDHLLLHLRPDTRFLGEGQVAGPGSLRANTKVFVRAGKNLDDEVEAYQVIWGEILHPEE